jgi:predicted metal-dependent hydrolase
MFVIHRQNDLENFDKHITIRNTNFSINMIFESRSTAVANIDYEHGIVVFKMPSNLNKKDTYDIASRLKDKVFRHMGKLPDEILNGSIKEHSLNFDEGNEFYIMGDILQVKIINGNRNIAIVDGNNLIIKMKEIENNKKELANKLARKALVKYYMPKVIERVNEINKNNFNYNFNNLRIKNQNTRWGSCSAKSRSINLNFRLLFAPNEILDYVIVHELAHLPHPNHSKRFWAEVSKVIPDYKQRVTWLRYNGSKLGIENPINYG